MSNNNFFKHKILTPIITLVVAALLLSLIYYSINSFKNSLENKIDKIIKSNASIGKDMNLMKKISTKISNALVNKDILPEMPPEFDELNEKTYSLYKELLNKATTINDSENFKNIMLSASKKKNTYIIKDVPISNLKDEYLFFFNKDEYLGNLEYMNLQINMINPSGKIDEIKLYGYYIEPNNFLSEVGMVMDESFNGNLYKINSKDYVSISDNLSTP